jgi:hypothetical protein
MSIGWRNNYVLTNSFPPHHKKQFKKEQYNLKHHPKFMHTENNKPSMLFIYKILSLSHSFQSTPVKPF